MAVAVPANAQDVLTASTSATSDLLPHRAVYELTLIDSARDSGIEDAAGLFIFEVDGSGCAGWTLESDMILSLQGRAGNTIRTQTSYRAFEDGQGNVFTFETSTETDNEVPVLSSGQWAGLAPDMYAGLGSVDLMHLAGGGIIGHPDGIAAGVASMREGWEAAVAGITLERYAQTHPALKCALAAFSER